MWTWWNGSLLHLVQSSIVKESSIWITLKIVAQICGPKHWRYIYLPGIYQDICQYVNETSLARQSNAVTSFSGMTLLAGSLRCHIWMSDTYIASQYFHRSNEKIHADNSTWHLYVVCNGNSVRLYISTTFPPFLRSSCIDENLSFKHVK